MKCGKEIPEGAQFCPNCGTQVGAVAKAEKHDYSAIGSTLVLIGGILALIFSVFPLALAGMWRSWIERFPGMMPWMAMDGRWIGQWILGFMVAGAIISIVLGIGAIYAYKKVSAGDVRNGGIIAIVLSVIMLVTGNWLPGIITLIGGLLCYASK